MDAQTRGTKSTNPVQPSRTRLHADELDAQTKRPRILTPLQMLMGTTTPSLYALGEDAQIPSPSITIPLPMPRMARAYSANGDAQIPMLSIFFRTQIWMTGAVICRVVATHWPSITSQLRPMTMVLASAPKMRTYSCTLALRWFHSCSHSHSFFVSPSGARALQLGGERDWEK